MAQQKILVISGKKESGKTSLANFLHGYELQRNGKIECFDVTEKGELLVNANFQDASGKTQEGMGLLDIGRTDREFIQYAEDSIWPYIKMYNFADRLKAALIIIFGVHPQQLYGTQDEKNTPTNVKWSDLKFLLSEEKCGQLSKMVVGESFRRENGWDKFLTARELAQVFGSDVCRKIRGNCWVEACYTDILQEGYPFVVVADARFPNELDYMKSKGAKLVRLTRSLHDDQHNSETALDSYPIENYDLVIDNQDLSIVDKNWKLLDYLLDIGWVSSLA